MTVDRTAPAAGVARRWPVLLGVLVVLVLLALVGLWLGGRAVGGTQAGPEAGRTSGVDESNVTATATTGPVPTTAAAEDATADADGDAETLATALAEVEQAAAELDEAVAVARAHHEQVAIPVRDLAVAHSEEFSQEVVDVLDAAVELSVEAVGAHGEGDAEARAEVAGEVARLESLAQEYRDATLTIRAGLQAVDETIYAVLSVAQDTGSQTAQTLTHSSDEASEAFALALEGLAEITAVPVADATWEQRTVERPSVLGDVVHVVEAYLVTARDARSSHALHAADDHHPDPGTEPGTEPDTSTEPGGGSGGGGRGGAGYACYKWGYFGSYLGWCY